jgi:hypothetical protein
MAITTRRALDGHRPTFTELFTPKLVAKTGLAAG